MKKICFCFLIYDIIVHEALWYNYLKNVNPEKYKIVIHYKQYKPLHYFESFKLKNCIPTEYGKISVVYAQNLMMQHCLEDSNTTHFCMLSGVCIPLKTFDYIYEYLEDNCSYFNYYKPEFCFPRCKLALKYLQKSQVKIANTNSIINRKHAEIIISNKSLYTKWFRKVKNADEHCHITLLNYLNLQSELCTTFYTSYSGATMFAAWPKMDDFKVYSLSKKSNSYTYNTICDEELNDLLESECLFGRKFMEKCTVLKNNIHFPLDRYLLGRLASYMPIFVINLKRRPDRLQKFDKQSYFNYEKIEAVDGRNSSLISENSHVFKKTRLHKLSKGEKGCILSHKKILDKMIAENIAICCVLEDDAVFDESYNFIEELKHIEENIIPRCELLYIGGKGNWYTWTSSKAMIKEGFYKKVAKNNFTTQGVVYTLKFAKRYQNAKFKYPIDWTYTIYNRCQSCIYKKQLVKYIKNKDSDIH